MTRVMGLVALAVCGVALMLTAAFAADFKIVSQGKLHAEGEGLARAIVVKGTLAAQVTGKVGISPATAKVKISGKPGKKTEVKDPKTGKVEGYIYKTFDGTLTASGEEYIITMEAKKLKLDLQGAGRTFLVGTGAYTATADGAKGKRAGKWSFRSTPETQAIPLPIDFGTLKVLEEPGKDGALPKGK